MKCDVKSALRAAVGASWEDGEHLILLSALIAFLLIGCGSSSPVIAPSEIEESDRGLPVVLLPFIDFAQPCPSPHDAPPLERLDTSIPESRFIVRFEGKRTPDEPHFRKAFRILVRRKHGLANVASCIVKPVGNLEDEIVTYEGVCEKPKRDNGECIVDVYRGTSFLVRSARFE